MTEEEKTKVEKEVFNELAQALRFEGIKIEKLDKKTLDLIMIGFQTGVKVLGDKWNKKMIEQTNANKRLLDEIPF